MTYDVIATGSSGNATVINREILIDCGVPYLRLREYARDIKLVLLTHQHYDHFRPSTIRAFRKCRPSVRFACCEWMVPLLIQAGADKGRIDVLEPDKWYYYSGISADISPFRTLHNVPNCGWRIFLERSTPCNSCTEKILYATDLSTLNGIKAKDYDLYFIECNHRQAEIEAKIAEKTAAGEFSYEIEAARNHLSWEQAMEWLAENHGPKSMFFPMHEHQEKGEKGNG